MSRHGGKTGWHNNLPCLLQGSVETIARGHEASVRIAMQGHHAAAAAARLPVATLSQMLKSALSVELDTRQVSQRLMRLIKADRWHMKAEQILRSHAKPTGVYDMIGQTGLLMEKAVNLQQLIHFQSEQEILILVCVVAVRLRCLHYCVSPLPRPSLLPLSMYTPCTHCQRIPGVVAYCKVCT